MVERAPDAATLPEETEVIVVGGGPAGTTAATIAAQQGRCVMLFERDTFPRFHVGESLIPECTRKLNMKKSYLFYMKFFPLVFKQNKKHLSLPGLF